MTYFILWLLALVGVFGACGENEEPPMRIIFALIAIASVVMIILTTPYIAR